MIRLHNKADIQIMLLKTLHLQFRDICVFLRHLLLYNVSDARSYTEQPMPPSTHATPQLELCQL